MQYEEGVGLHTHSRGVAPSTPSTTSQVRLSIAVIVIYIYMLIVSTERFRNICLSMFPSYLPIVATYHTYIYTYKRTISSPYLPFYLLSIDLPTIFCF